MATRSTSSSDREGLRRTVERLNQGDFERLIADALEQWRRFAGTVISGGDVVIIDGCLFGYLTWSLFPVNVPVQQIGAYVAEVAKLIAPANPCLISLYQEDVGASLRRICDRRGAATEQRLLEQSTQSPYGRRHGLNGFDGMVEYWTAYRDLTDAMYDTFSFSKIAIETGAGDWPAHQRQALDVLDLPPGQEPPLSAGSLDRYVGTYAYTIGDHAGAATVGLRDRVLILNGMPEVWPDTPLIPVGQDRFAVESLPFEVSFEYRASGEVVRMIVTGPELLSGPTPRVLRRIGP